MKFFKNIFKLLGGICAKSKLKGKYLVRHTAVLISAVYIATEIFRYATVQKFGVFRIFSFFLRNEIQQAFNFIKLIRSDSKHIQNVLMNTANAVLSTLYLSKKPENAEISCNANVLLMLDAIILCHLTADTYTSVCFLPFR